MEKATLVREKFPNFCDKIKLPTQYILTLDEVMLPNDHTNGQADYSYAKKNVGERDKPALIATSPQQVPEQR